MSDKWFVRRGKENIAGPFAIMSEAFTWCAGACMDHLLPRNAKDVPKDWPGIYLACNP